MFAELGPRNIWRELCCIRNSLQSFTFKKVQNRLRNGR